MGYGGNTLGSLARRGSRNYGGEVEILRPSISGEDSGLLCGDQLRVVIGGECRSGFINIRLKKIGFSWSFRSPGTPHGSDGMQKREIDLRLGCEVETSTFLLGRSADRQIPSP